jgi:hypothetical protein
MISETVRSGFKTDARAGNLSVAPKQELLKPALSMALRFQGHLQAEFCLEHRHSLSPLLSLSVEQVSSVSK